jgi:hypothetical protein
MTFFDATVLAAGVFGALLLFAFELLPAEAPRLVRGAPVFVSWAAIAAFAACSIGGRVTMQVAFGSVGARTSASTRTNQRPRA